MPAAEGKPLVDDASESAIRSGGRLQRWVRIGTWPLAVLAIFFGVGRRVEVLSLPGRAAATDAATVDDRPVRDLEQQLDRLMPRGPMILIDSYANQFRVVDGDTVLREGPCSTGSGAVLRDPSTGRLWVFDTPTGEHTVREKVADPVWVKPDWAFIEEGQKPPPGRSSRLDDVSLGAYGLYLGDGYIIHGTLFQTLLGKSATHGCIRLGDEDLEFVYRRLPVGARVFVY